MPDFAESLQGKDLGHVHIIAQLWGGELTEQEVLPAIRQLKAFILVENSIDKMITSLGAEAKVALNELCQHSGRLPWAQFTRTYGEVREMGPARRDRERPFESPASVTEALWYRGILARAFFDAPAGPEEFGYIPQDIFVLIPLEKVNVTPRMGRPASTKEYARIFKAGDRILDHTCTYLAALRVGASPAASFFTEAGEELTGSWMKNLSMVAGLVEGTGKLRAEAVRQFLEIDRAEALLRLYQAWKPSATLNELRLLPGLAMEGKWQNDPVRARQAVLGWLGKLEPATWWNLESFIAAVKQRSPDFQRPAGDYDTWFIKEQASGNYLRGFEHWDEVDGRLIRYLVTGVLHWLGLVDVALPEAQEEVTAFRLSRWSGALFKDQAPAGLPQEKEPVIARSDARLSARRLVPRGVRYQLARFCEWEKETPDEYRYQVTPGSLARAKQQGLKVSQLVSLLNRNAKAVPPSLLKALERWEKTGSAARLEKMVVLRVSSEEVLQALRNSRASRFLGEPLGPAAIAIQPGAAGKLLAVLAELGYLGEIRGEFE